MKGAEFKPLAYIGILLALGGLLIPTLLKIEDGLIQLIGIIVFVIGLYLVLRGRKKSKCS